MTGDRGRATPEAVVEAILDASPDAMIVSDSRGRIVRANGLAATLFGYDRDELLRCGIEDLVPRRMRSSHERFRHEYDGKPELKPMSHRPVPLFGLRKDGTEFPAEITLGPLQVESGVWTVAAIRDVTERRRRELERARLEQIDEANRLRDEFVSAASHELRTPIAALQLQLDSLERMVSGAPVGPIDKRVHGRFEVTHRALHRVTSLIDQLIDATQATSGEMPLDRSTVDLRVLVERIAAAEGPEFERAGCTLTIAAAEGVTVFADERRLERLLGNLIHNAQKFGRGCPVEIEVRAVSASTARIVVRDHGTGIAAEDRDRIFRRYERAASPRNFGGLGVGLWLARRIVEAHGGTIDFESVEGGGAAFIVEIPRVDGQTHVLCKSVLLVDDDAGMRAAFADAMRDEGFSVQTAVHGAHALQILRCGATPGIIFSDVSMPVLDGPGLLAELKQDPALGAIPVVFYTARSDFDETRRRLDGVTVIRKPFPLQTAIELVEKYCSG